MMRQSYLSLTLAMVALQAACTKVTAPDAGSQLADVKIQELLNQDYTRYEFALEQQDGSFKVPKTSFNKGSQAISAKVPPGRYKFTLDYYKGQEKILSSAFCADDARKDVQQLFAGPNNIQLPVCNPSAGLVDPGAPTKPVVINPPPSSKPVSGETFRIQSGELLDATGKPFIFRGVNMPFAYYFEPSFNAIETARNAGFNAVRLIWCADNYQDWTQRCQSKDNRSAGDLDRVLTKLNDQQMVAIFNLQNATGNDGQDALQAMVNYLTRSDIRMVLLKHKRNVLINIANEWMGNWSKNRNWVDGYRQAIQSLRAAQLPHVLIIDARGFGQDFSSIEESYQELLSLDPNILFSLHMYAEFGSELVVQEKLNSVRSRRIPLIIGEFGCSHFDDTTRTSKTVACDAIMREASSSSYPIGYMAWSYSGNRSEESQLDIFNSWDWRQLSAYGEKIVNGTYGVRATGKKACMFDSSRCP